MILRFDPVPGYEVPLPGYPVTVGQPLRLVTPGTECDAASEVGRRLSKLAIRDGSVAPADKATADALGLPFEAPAKGGKAS